MSKPKPKLKPNSQTVTKPTRVRTAIVEFDPQTSRQAELVDSINRNTVTFAVGAPGTGKTFVGMAMALKALFDKKCEKIIVTRPTISSGPDIGYLPGTEEEKMAPFLVPIMDAIYKLIPQIIADDLIDAGKIEIASISFVRGRNFENAYVIVDEAENLDRKSFYLLLTRVCEGSKIIFCGDSSQIDLRNTSDSGLEDAIQKFTNKEEFGVVEFTIEDCRRSPMVKEVIRAYFPDLNNAPSQVSYRGAEGKLGIPKRSVDDIVSEYEMRDD